MLTNAVDGLTSISIPLVTTTKVIPQLPGYFLFLFMFPSGEGTMAVCEY